MFLNSFLYGRERQGVLAMYLHMHFSSSVYASHLLKAPFLCIVAKSGKGFLAYKIYLLCYSLSLYLHLYQAKTSEENNINDINFPW